VWCLCAVYNSETTYRKDARECTAVLARDEVANTYLPLRQALGVIFSKLPLSAVVPSWSWRNHDMIHADAPVSSPYTAVDRGGVYAASYLRARRGVPAHRRPLSDLHFV
ncbi:unnamed protein product, partial [Ectocarpus sp. 4 AP-2014]